MRILGFGERSLEALEVFFVSGMKRNGIKGEDIEPNKWDVARRRCVMFLSVQCVYMDGVREMVTAKEGLGNEGDRENTKEQADCWH